jgi:beta-phosphoglucomutase-like phosphatase (HAD superfamily)
MLLEGRRTEMPLPTREPLDLDALAAGWWVACESAERALDAASQFLSALEAREHRGRLAEQRGKVAQLLQGLARDVQRTSPLVEWLDGRRLTRRVLGLPSEVIACVFDIDGVLTNSASVHAAAWADTLDDFLVERADPGHHEFVPFDQDHEYELLIAERPRLDGVRAFLASRGMSLPEGRGDDPPAAHTVHGLANRKNERLQRRLQLGTVTAFAGSRSYLEAARMFGVHRAVVSPSANTAAILERGGLARLIEERVDGSTLDADRLRPKPSPDTLLAACRRLHVQPGQSAAFETTPAGIAAARAAGFGFVIGVARNGHGEALHAGGADLVITDLAGLLRWRPSSGGQEDGRSPSRPGKSKKEGPRPDREGA